jgi:hypothetical protein
VLRFGLLCLCSGGNGGNVICTSEAAALYPLVASVSTFDKSYHQQPPLLTMPITATEQDGRKVSPPFYKAVIPCFFVQAGNSGGRHV